MKDVKHVNYSTQAMEWATQRNEEIALASLSHYAKFPEALCVSGRVAFAAALPTLPINRNAV